MRPPQTSWRIAKAQLVVAAAMAIRPTACTPASTSVEAGTHISLGEVQFGAFNLAGDALDLGLHIDLGDAAHTLLGGLADGLGNLPLIGGLPEDAGSTPASTTGNLLSTLGPVVSLAGIDGDPSGAHASDVGSPGQLNFADSSSPAASHELATPSGGYTNYGIALNLGASDIAHGSAEAAVHADALSVSALDSLPTDHLPGGDLNVPSDALHLDQSLLRTASDILA